MSEYKTTTKAVDQLRKCLPGKWGTYIQIISAVGVIGAIVVGIINHGLSKKQLTLQLRPFVVIEKASFGFPRDPVVSRHWFVVTYSLQNYGEQPAHEFQIKNDKVIKISPSAEQRKKLKASRSEQDVSTREKISREIVLQQKEIIKKLYLYLQDNPMALSKDINNQFGAQGVYCYGDILDYFPEPTVLIPDETKKRFSNRDVGSYNGQKIADEEDIIVYYTYVSYEGVKKNRPFYTFYLGYYSERESKLLHGKAPVDFVKPLREFKQWIPREDI